MRNFAKNWKSLSLNQGYYSHNIFFRGNTECPMVYPQRGDLTVTSFQFVKYYPHEELKNLFSGGVPPNPLNCSLRGVVAAISFQYDT